MPYQFDHVAHVVPAIAPAVAWYQSHIPGARVLYQDDSWAFLDVSGVRVALVSRDEHPGHVAWRVEDTELDALAAQHGTSVKPHRDGSRSFYLEGPGNQWLEIISYPAGDPFAHR